MKVGVVVAFFAGHFTLIGPDGFVLFSRVNFSALFADVRIYRGYSGCGRGDGCHASGGSFFLIRVFSPWWWVYLRCVRGVDLFLCTI